MTGEAGSPRGAGLATAGAVVIAAVALMRCVVFFAPQVVFDVDPATDRDPIGGLGPAGSLWLDIVLLGGVAAALAGWHRGGGRVRVLVWALALVPLPVVLWHGHGDADDLWRGATWAASILAAAAILEIAATRRLRVLLAALLLAVAGPLLARGAANVTYEHAENIARYEASRDQILADRGWAPDSPFALIFERRLQQREPVGWFVTTNVYATLMASLAVVFAGLAAGARRARMTGGWVGLLAIAAGAAATAVVLSGSKGAMGAVALGAGLLLAPRASRAFAGATWLRSRRVGGVMAVAVVLAVLAGVAVRGAVLPESFAGDRSLLFRWHYTVASARILAAHPWVGVGPDGYQAAYVEHRVPRNPEEVASAHAVFWDWLAGLGLGAAAWVGLVFLLAWRAGATWSALSSLPAERGPPPASRLAGIAVFAVVVALVTAVGVELPVLHPQSLAVRMIGIGAYAVLAIALVHVLGVVESRWADWSIAAAAITALAHAQIEMTMTQPGAATWSIALLALAGAPRADEPPATPDRRGRRAGAIVAVVVFAAAAWIGVTGAIPATRQERHLLDAAAILWPLAETPDAPGVAGTERARREAAAATLLTAYAALPTALGPRLEAAGQLEKAARLARGPEQIALLESALAHAEAGIAAGDRGRAPVLACFVNHALWQLTGDPARADAAIDAARLVVDADPHSPHAARRVGDLLWERGRTEEAVTAYRRALDLDDGYDLDPLKRFPPAARAVIEDRVAAQGVRDES